MQLLTYSFATHQTFRTNPSLIIHIKTCVRHKYYRSNQSITNIVISDLLDLIHHQIPGCIFHFRSSNSLIAYYTFFKSNYHKIFITCTNKYFDLHLLLQLSTYPIPQVKTILMPMVIFDGIKYLLLCLILWVNTMVNTWY